VLETLPEFRDNPEDLGSLYLHPNVPVGAGAAANSSKSIPLSVLARQTRTTAPLSINHQGQFPVVTVSFNLSPGVSLGQAVKAVNTAEAELELPASIQAG